MLFISIHFFVSTLSRNFSVKPSEGGRSAPSHLGPLQRKYPSHSPSCILIDPLGPPRKNINFPNPFWQFPLTQNLSPTRGEERRGDALIQKVENTHHQDGKG